MKRIVIATILAGCMMTAHVSAGEMLAGGWKATTCKVTLQSLA